MNKASQIWNRALGDYRLASSAVGDRALAEMLLAHGLVMNGGVLNAVEILDESQLSAAVSGYKLFGLDQVADLFSRAKDILARGSADPVERERCTVGEIEVVQLEEDDHLDEFEPRLDAEYTRYLPDDSALFDRFERHLATNPCDFASL